MVHHTVHDVHVPSVIPMHEGFCEGAKIDIHGHILAHDRYTVELLSGPHVVLHIDFRFGHGHEHVVVLNTQKHHTWGHEVHVNGHHLADFEHRLPMESVQALGLRGHAKVEKVHFEGFRFSHAWGGHSPDHFGHEGWNGYGTEHYVAPVFVDGHAHAGFF